MSDCFNLLGVNISAVDLSKAFAILREAVLSRALGYVCVAPVSTIVDCQRLEGYKKIINGALLVTPDGMPVVWLGKLQGHQIERTYGPDLMRLTLDLGRKDHLRHFLYGSSDDVCISLKAEIARCYPGANIVGTYSPAYFRENRDEDSSVIERINQAKADIIWVGLGSPKQDFWMHAHRGRLNAPLLIGIGAAFDFISGIKPQAPVWIQRIGFEWLFRLCCEPRRLWRRYLIGNSLFIYYLFMNLFKKKI